MLHNNDHLDNDLQSSLRKSLQDFFQKPSSVGEAVATAFILENIELFRQFLSKHPKMYEVSAHRWLDASIDSINKSKLHLETVSEFQIEFEKGVGSNFDDWRDALKAQENQAKERFFSRSYTGRSSEK